jgi:hypothetical protein
MLEMQVAPFVMSTSSSATVVGAQIAMGVIQCCHRGAMCYRQCCRRGPCQTYCCIGDDGAAAARVSFCCDFFFSVQGQRGRRAMHVRDGPVGTRVIQGRREIEENNPPGDAQMPK